MSRKPSVLFLDAHNSDRSQIAEALLRHLAGERFEVMSAGVAPRPVHPLTRRVLEEIGVNGGALVPKGIETYLARSVVHYAVLIKDDNPSSPRIYPFATHVVHWPVSDPLEFPASGEELLDHFRDTRDAIRMNLQTWLGEVELARSGLGDLAPTEAPSAS